MGFLFRTFRNSFYKHSYPCLLVHICVHFCNGMSLGGLHTAKVVPFLYSHHKCRRTPFFLGFANTWYCQCFLFYFIFTSYILAINSTSSWFHFSFPWWLMKLNSFHVYCLSRYPLFLKCPILKNVLLILQRFFIYSGYESFIRYKCSNIRQSKP